MRPINTDALRSGLVKCAKRMPGESVTLTDDEIYAILSDHKQAGFDEAINAVSTVAVVKLRAQRDELLGELKILNEALDDVDRRGSYAEEMREAAVVIARIEAEK